MRSPVRIDFDPSSESDMHPSVHMHTQNHECRIRLDSPICFNKFLKFIIQNFYPEINMIFKSWNMLNFTFEKSKIKDYQGTVIAF